MKQSFTINDIPQILKSLTDKQIYIENFTTEQIFYQLKDITDEIIKETEIFIKETETLSSNSFLNFINSTNQLDCKQSLNEENNHNIPINHNSNETIESNEHKSFEKTNHESNEETDKLIKKNKIENLLNKKTAKEILNFLDEEVECSISTDNSISSTYLNDY